MLYYIILYYVILYPSNNNYYRSTTNTRHIIEIMIMIIIIKMIIIIMLMILIIIIVLIMIILMAGAAANVHLQAYSHYCHLTSAYLRFQSPEFGTQVSESHLTLACIAQGTTCSSKNHPDSRLTFSGLSNRRKRQDFSSPPCRKPQL